MNIKLIPLERVEIDDVIITLGMEKQSVEKAIGIGECIRMRHYYYNSEMGIDYDSDNCVEFIEFLGGIEGFLHPFIYGVSAFETNAEELVELLRNHNAGDIDDSEQGHSYAFLNTSIGIYRESTPASVLEFIEEMRADGVSIEDNENLKLEKIKAEHWATIGIGVEGYYQ